METNKKIYLTLKNINGRVIYFLIIDEKEIELILDITTIKNEIAELIENNMTFEKIKMAFRNSMEYFLLNTIYNIANNEILNFKILLTKNKITIMREDEFLFETVIRFETFLLFSYYKISTINDLNKIFN